MTALGKPHIRSVHFPSAKMRLDSRHETVLWSCAMPQEVRWLAQGLGTMPTGINSSPSSKFSAV